MGDKKVKDHISGVAPGTLNAAETLFGFDANALRDARLNPDALAALKDLQADAKFWAKNGKRIRQYIETVCVGTAEKTVTLGMVAQAANKFGKPIIKTKYNAALAEKKFNNFLTETKHKAAHDFGMENARHATQMQTQMASQKIATGIFKANVTARYNNLLLQADSANKNIQDQQQDFKATAALTVGSRAPSPTTPSRVERPTGVDTNPIVIPALGTGAVADTSTGRGLFGFFGRAINSVRKFFGI